jgi:adenine deaminase
MYDPELVKASLGEVKADLVVKGGCLVNVSTGELLEGFDVAVKGSRIAYVGPDASHAMGGGTEVVDAKGLYVAPGLIDAHTHIDLYCTPMELSRAALLHGTTTLFAEPDELANVMGFEGLKLFRRMVRGLPLKVYILIPLVCPQDPLFDENRPLTLEEVRRALRWREAVGLGEAVSWPRLLSGDLDYAEKVALAQRMGKVVEGHTAGARGVKLQGYVASGIYSCHEPVAWSEALERLRLGVYVMAREGSLRRDLANVLPGLLDKPLARRNLSIASDSVDPEDLVKLGYMDYAVRRAVELGVDPVEAIAMATLNPAKRFGLEGEVGCIAPGREADMVLLRSLERVEVEATISRGRLMAKAGRLLFKPRRRRWPKSALSTVRVARGLQPSDFEVKVDARGPVSVRVMELESESITRERLVEAEVEGGLLKPPRGVLRAAVVDRLYATGRISLGLLKGWAEVGGVATTLNFDENNLVVVGARAEDMALAANRVVAMGGGIAIADGGEVRLELAMPLAGVMSLSPLEEVAYRLSRMNEYLRGRGCALGKPLNALLFITFVTLPELRLSVKGLVDVKRRRLVPLIVEG